jgi:LysR family transcriptional regulator of gallate degradation
MFDLRELEYFLTIAERRSFTAAAAELNITQPALTKSIRLLEDALGVQLFRRLPRGVELTPYGASLARHARVVRVQVKDAISDIQTLQSGVSGRITIGAGPAWLRRLLPAAVSALVREKPLVRVRIVGGFDEAVLQNLRLGEIDAALVEVPSSEESADLEVHPLTSDKLVVACRKDHPLTQREEVRISDLLTALWALPPRATRSRRRLDSLFISRELPPPDAVVETESGAFLLSLLKESDALTYTTRRTLDQSDASDLTEIQVPELAAERIAGFITRKGQTMSPPLAVLFSTLRALAEADGCN